MFLARAQSFQPQSRCQDFGAQGHTNQTLITIAEQTFHTHQPHQSFQQAFKTHQPSPTKAVQFHTYPMPVEHNRLLDPSLFHTQKTGK